MQAKITWYFDSNSDDNEDKEWLANAYAINNCIPSNIRNQKFSLSYIYTR